MPEKNLLYIKDANGRKLFYHFTPAAFISNFVPLVVILHDQGESKVTHFEHKMWNVLTPVDTFGFENKGSCWLGEEGDFFVKDLLQQLIYQIIQEYECEDHIYICGNGMGGYGAILHGTLCKANAIYTDNPYIKLQETCTTDNSMKQFYDSIFTKTVSKESDLNNFLNPRDDFPIFYICHDGINSDTTNFIDTCKKHDIKVYPNFCSESEYDEGKRLKEVLNFFERIASEV